MSRKRGKVDMTPFRGETCGLAAAAASATLAHADEAADLQRTRAGCAVRLASRTGCAVGLACGADLPVRLAGALTAGCLGRSAGTVRPLLPRLAIASLPIASLPVT